MTTVLTTVAQTVATALAACGDHVFALMGNGNAHVLDALARADVPVTAVRHEAATVASADAYHRVTGRLAVATTTYGAGFTNTVTALAEATLAGTPLLLLVGDAPTSGPRAFDIDQSAVVHATGAHLVVLDAAAPGRAVVAAAAHAVAHRVPVVIALPYDLATAPVADATVPAPAATSPLGVDGSALDTLAAQLAEAKRPLVLAGRGARGHAEAVGRLADRLGALTATTAPARGLFDGRPYDLGVCGGFAAPQAAALIHEADVVLVLGAGLNQFTTKECTAFGPDAVVVQVDLRPEPTSALVTRAVRGDVGVVLAGLLDRLGGRVPLQPWSGAAEAARDGDLHLRRERGDDVAPDGRLDPRAVFARLEELLPSRRQVVSDGGHFLGWANTYLSAHEPDSVVLVGTAFQSIGLGLPSAPGALVARPDITTLIVLGDGGGLMGIADLETVVRCATSALVLVVNDAVYGAEVHQYGSLGLDQTVMRVGEVDFAAVGRALGAQGVVVERLADLDAVERWLADGARGTFVADVRVSPDIVAPYMWDQVAAAARG
ncbi:thiamine pyrophosphate-binding protein [Xylanimonas sp. McL0601]|uniref:thiamine pyrophosphate-binding protein n=1 Tax=Xylanimonas sp. McL0601 TaxID=3414739 RepID=UPI003CF84297